VAAVLPVFPAGANPVPLAARNPGSLSRRFDILLQSRALVTERHLVLDRLLPADSALKDGLMQLSPTAAHISHSGVQPTAPQVSIWPGEHHTVR
jgi:hypothetical protein